MYVHVHTSWALQTTCLTFALRSLAQCAAIVDHVYKNPNDRRRHRPNSLDLWAWYGLAMFSFGAEKAGMDAATSQEVWSWICEISGSGRFSALHRVICRHSSREMETPLWRSESKAGDNTERHPPGIWKLVFLMILMVIGIWCLLFPVWSYELKTTMTIYYHCFYYHCRFQMVWMVFRLAGRWTLVGTCPKIWGLEPPTDYNKRTHYFSMVWSVWSGVFKRNLSYLRWSYRLTVKSNSYHLGMDH
jgi:hypothetical protein